MAGLLSADDLARMRVEDGRQRALRDDEELRLRGIFDRKFNPSEPRDPHSGKWSSVGGTVHDALKLAGRIQLGKDEHLVGSAKVGDGRGDVSVLMARVDGPNGPTVRWGQIPTDRAREWRAADKGATVVLDESAVQKLRQVLADAPSMGKKSVSDFRAAIRAAHARGEPMDNWPDPEADIAKGVIAGTAWGDIGWNLTREEGDYYTPGGVDLGVGGEWNLAFEIQDPKDRFALDHFNVTTAATAQKLEKALADLMAIPSTSVG